ncbi:hypothetical protein OIU78_024974 [Salix suchowensis]|nr:hypothetical protein OIU78_024974 [Salix suchowensis]
MTFLREITTSTAFYVQLSIILLITIMQHSEARELRPSDHGLEYQSLPPTGAKLPPHMKHFFGASNSATRNTMPPSTGAALPHSKLKRHVVVESCWRWRHKTRPSSSSSAAAAAAAAYNNHRSITVYDAQK